jgi:hypothetical protein
LGEEVLPLEKKAKSSGVAPGEALPIARPQQGTEFPPNLVVLNDFQGPFGNFDKSFAFSFWSVAGFVEVFGRNRINDELDELFSSGKTGSSPSKEEVTGSDGGNDPLLFTANGEVGLPLFAEFRYKK